ncbi:MAG: 1-deoxy-D-xylulose-5-phosphate reductoisomerase, partial [Bacteroidota bacterium]|nr:1-deoxy-D-xylulose-5-phosphate reductoisomerase [Bacteroidota bacterium]
MSESASKSLTILGSTGSIGRNTLDVVRRNSHRFSVKAISANTSVDEVRSQIAEFHPETVVMTNSDAFTILQKEFGSLIRTGEDALNEICSREGIDIVVAAMVGSAGLRPTLEAIRAGKRVTIANKETLVVAGELMTALAKITGAEIIP